MNAVDGSTMGAVGEVLSAVGRWELGEREDYYYFADLTTMKIPSELCQCLPAA